ncbi:MAG: hypothetical protein QG622_2340 [Actinomycetota bacterium]|nr:hypothetical protein [Actinomycetota bacterium]
MTPSGRRSAAIAIPLSVLVGAVLTGCGGAGPDYQGVCQDTATNRRLPDASCSQSDRDDGGRGGGGGHGGGGTRWVYLPRGSHVAPVGAPLSGWTSSAPHGASVARGGAPVKGGVVNRGGFGGRGGKGVGG